MKPKIDRSPGSIVREIKRRTRRKFNPEEKIRIILEGLNGEDSISGIVVERALLRVCITNGARLFCKPANAGSKGIRFVKRTAMKSVGYARRMNS